MYIQDYDTVPPPSDFGPDPVHHHFFFDGGILVVLVIVAIWLLSAVYGRANFRAARKPRNAIEQRVDRVVRAMREAARANQASQRRLADEVKAAIDEQFSASLELSQALNKVVGPLNKALDGTREEEAVIKPLNGPSTIMGGATVINIAVGGGAGVGPETVTAGGAAAAVPGEIKVEGPAVVEPMSEAEHRAAIWTAVQRLFNAWKNKAGIIAAFHAAQMQLMQSPAWEPPFDRLPPGDPRRGRPL